MRDVDLATEPLNTSLDRAMLAARYSNGGELSAAYAAAGWNLLTPAERSEMWEYHQALRENAVRDNERSRNELKRRSAE